MARAVETFSVAQQHVSFIGEIIEHIGKFSQFEWQVVDGFSLFMGQFAGFAEQIVVEQGAETVVQGYCVLKGFDMLFRQTQLFAEQGDVMGDGGDMRPGVRAGDIFGEQLDGGNCRISRSSP